MSIAAVVGQVVAEMTVNLARGETVVGHLSPKKASTYQSTLPDGRVTVNCVPCVDPSSTASDVEVPTNANTPYPVALVAGLH